MDQIDISVIVLTCNRPERCRDSVQKNQAELADFSTEWWIVNNGEEAVELPSDSPAPTRLIQMPHNGGTAARNAVLGKAAGSCLLMIDDDAYIHRESISSALEQLKQHPQAGGVILPVENESCLLPTIFHGCAVLFSTAALEAAGGYPTDYLYYGEEYEVSFRLASAGYLMLQAEPGTPEAIHVRDARGRNTNHILYRLVRNNTCCWARSLPFRHLWTAMYDTMHRYHHVSIKEKSRKGYLRGLVAMPAALLRGLFSRHALDETNYGEISLNTAVAETGRAIKAQGMDHVVLCGLGKFPSGWLKILKKQGLKVIAFLEQNHAFHESRLNGIQILPPEMLPDVIDDNTALLSGTSSAPANAFWKQTLERSGYTLCSEGPQVQAWKGALS
jgi:GT2 family glycosyltransferase